MTIRVATTVHRSLLVSLLAAVLGGLALPARALPNACLEPALPSTCECAARDPAKDEGPGWWRVECVYSHDDAYLHAMHNAGQLEGTERSHALDIYLPDLPAAELAGAPVVFYLHGGGLVTGDKRNGAPSDIARGLARQGFVVVSANYTLRALCYDNGSLCSQDLSHQLGCLPCSPIDAVSEVDDSFVGETQVMRDVAEAFAWSYRELWSAGYGDPSRATLMGHSAGAYLAMLLAAERGWLLAALGDPGGRVSDYVAGVVALSMTPNLNLVASSGELPLRNYNDPHLSKPFYDLQDLLPSLIDLSGYDPSRAAYGWQWASPHWHLLQQRAAGTVDSPPMLLASGEGQCNPLFECTINGQEDFPDPPAMRESLAAYTLELQAAGVPASYVQPVITGQIQVFGQWKRCWAHVSHGVTAALLADPPSHITKFRASQVYAQQTSGLCNLMAAQGRTAVSETFRQTVFSFLGAVSTAHPPARVTWAAAQPGESPVPGGTHPFSLVSVPDPP